jgi:hypothetical protein
MTKKELAELKARSDADLARTRAEPGYADILAEVRSEVEAAELTARIIDGSNLTQTEIARRMDVSQPYIAQLRKGRHPTLPTLFRLARACGVSLRISAAL